MGEHMEQKISDVLARIGMTERVEFIPDEDELPPHEYVREQMLRHGAQRWASVVPKRFLDARIERVSETAAPTLADWMEGEPLTNLIIGGPVGVGKTWAALATVRPLVETGKTLGFWPLVELLDALRPGGDDSVWHLACSVDILVLDDLGAERPTDWTAERLFALVNRRWMNQLPIVATTNFKQRDLELAIGPRVFSRLVGGATTLRLSGEDRRRA